MLLYTGIDYSYNGREEQYMIKCRSPFILMMSVPAFIMISCVSGPGRLQRVSEKYEVAEWSGIPVTMTKYGRVEGFPDKENTWVWRGIPYAGPPVGPLRWKPPVEPEPWAGTLKAKRFGPMGVQYRPIGKNRITGSEDCLYLNVWRPQTGETGLPVYVWIYGGGNTTGSGDYTKEYYGYHLARQSNAVFVSINYRIGPFGWFTHPALRAQAQNDLEASGNFGTLDIIHSLKWVRDNIRAFGGNPDNVTVAGESTGGINILSLIISPVAQGLFHKAIIRSGGFVMSSVEDGDASAEAVLMKLLSKKIKDEEEAASLREAMDDREVADFFYSLPAREIQSFYEPWHFGMTDMPTLFKDGTVIPESGARTLGHGTYPSKVPVMIGSNTDEIKLFMYWDKQLRKNENRYAAVTGYGSGMWKVNGVDSIARQMTKHRDQPPVYAYLFNWGSLDENGESVFPGKKGFFFGASHALEIPFFMGSGAGSPVLGLFFLTGKNKPGASSLTEAVMAYQTSFLWNGHTRDVPDALPGWPAWTNNPGSPKFMILDAGFKERKLTMSSDDYTEKSVLEYLESTYGPDITAEALAYIEEEGINFESVE